MPNLTEDAMTESETVDAEWTRRKEGGLTRHPDTTPGKMMTADALTRGGKVFVFRSRRNGHGLGCKLGDKAPEAFGTTEWKPLQPFKGKAPMRGWFVVGPRDAGLWPKIAEAALAHARDLAEASA